jgi:hypothetical protein
VEGVEMSFCQASITSDRRLIALVKFGTYPTVAVFRS